MWEGQRPGESGRETRDKIRERGWSEDSWGKRAMHRPSPIRFTTPESIKYPALQTPHPQHDAPERSWSIFTVKNALRSVLVKFGF